MNQKRLFVFKHLPWRTCLVFLLGVSFLTIHGKAFSRETAISVASLKTLQQDTIPQKSWVLYGTVTDNAKKPVPGASVNVTGSQGRGASSDVNGNFMIEMHSETDTLEVSFIGYVTQKIVPGLQRNIVVELLPDEVSQKLNEIVVVGFGTQKKVTVTGAVSSVSMANVQRVATPSLSVALAGSMPGIVTRQSSGEPGYDGAAVYIRGFGTFAANRAPLFLVDGVERGINNINTQEIESITMLKDASATAVYGVNGANGVILITTKRGKLGKPSVTLRTENAVLTAMRLPSYINGVEYAGLVNEARRNEGQDPLYSPAELEAYADGRNPYLYPNVDWVSAILKKNTFQSINNLSVTGGTEMIKYYANAGYTQQDGIYKQNPDNFWNNNARMKRYNFRSNLDMKLSETVQFELGVGGILQRGNYPGRSAPDIFNALKITSPINFPVTNPDGSIAGGQTSYLQENPYGLVARSGYSTQDRNTLQATVAGTWDLSKVLTKGLSIRGLFSYDHYYMGWNDRVKPYAIRQYLGKDQNNNDLYRTPDIREEGPMGYRTGSAANRTYYTELRLNYTKSIGLHNLAGMFLYNQRDYTDITAGNSLANLPFRKKGVAGRVNYDYARRYMLEFNMGYNGSEQFPAGKRYGFFPSASAGWVISNEDFWQSDVINSLKIRGSFGQVGNDRTNLGRRFLFLTKIGTRSNFYPYGEQQTWFPGYIEEQIGNNDVTWEVATKTNLGIDMEFFKGALVLQLDGFRENRGSILIQRATLPAIAGYNPDVIPFANLGKAKNYGIDGLLEFKKTTASGWYYNVRATVTYAKSIQVKDDFPTYLYPYQNPIGHLIDQPFGYVSLGLFQSEEEIQNSPKQTFMEQVRPGDIKYMDVNGDGKIDVFDKVAIGYPRTPQLTYGSAFTVAYKGAEVSLFFSGVSKTSLFVDGQSMYPFDMGLGTYNVMREYYDNRWTPETPDALYPRVSTMKNLNNSQTSTHYLRDASYLRLRSAEIAYQFRLSTLERIGVKNVRLFINGMNLITWDKIKVIDPESDYGTGGYPLQRSINFGGQFNF